MGSKRNKSNKHKLGMGTRLKRVSKGIGYYIIKPSDHDGDISSNVFRPSEQRGDTSSA